MDCAGECINFRYFWQAVRLWGYVADILAAAKDPDQRGTTVSDAAAKGFHRRAARPKEGLK